MRRPRHRVKSNLLWKMLGIAVLANVLMWPILIRLGAFHGVRQELIPVTIVAKPPSPKAPAAPPKAPVIVKAPPKPVPVIAAKPPIPAPTPAPKRKPVLVASAPPAPRRPDVTVAEKPSVPSMLSPDTHVRRRPRAAHRAPKDVLTAKETPPRRVREHPAPKIAAARPPAKPAPKKPAERVATRPPTLVVNPAPSPTPPAPAVVPDGNTVSPTATSASLLKPAVAVVKTQPTIPRSMQNHAWHALFRGEFVVNKAGSVTPRMVSSTGNADLDARALAAARHWKFRPATQNGVPIASKVNFEIEYAVRAVP